MKRLAAFVLIILVAGLAAWRYWGGGSGAAHADVFQGYTEGDLLYLGPVEGERLARLDVDIGQEVTARQQLFEMSTHVLDTQRNEQLARMNQAQSQVEDLQAAQQRPEQIAVLEAAVTRAQAALVLSQNDFDRQSALFPKGATTKALLDQAQAALSRDKASLEEANRQVIAAKLGGRVQEIDAAKAAVLAARAQLRQFETRIRRQSVFSPAAGVVQDVFFRPGEMVNAGQPVLSLLPPENRKVRFYVAETRLADFALGRKVAVSCDNCPAGLVATVIFMSKETEFTPPVIFSEQERAKLVFRLEAKLTGGGARLPLGLPVTVRLLPKDRDEAASQ
ncbi:MAG: HlyD family efflux transporter periplasmic adaptor subunit [Hyphomicrobiales bacterium]|nr:HlyD family efflux transporter periplasmic adaptor subunit [Hyphomicrobiales bacterium]